MEIMGFDRPDRTHDFVVFFFETLPTYPQGTPPLPPENSNKVEDGVPTELIVKNGSFFHGAPINGFIEINGCV